MAIIETDGLVRATDLTYINADGATRTFSVGRLTTVTASGKSYVVMGSEDYGVGSVKLGSNGSLDFKDVLGTIDVPVLGESWFEATSLTSIDRGRSAYVYVSGKLFGEAMVPDNSRGITVLKVDGSGNLSLVQRVSVDGAPSGTHGNAVSSLYADPQVVQVGGRDVLFVPIRPQNSSVTGYQLFEIGSGGRLTKMSQTMEEKSFGFSKFTIAQAGGNQFLIDFGPYNSEPMQVYRIHEDGRMVKAFALPTSESAIYNTQTMDITSATIGASTFVFVAEITAGALLVFSLDVKGQLTLVEREVANTGDGWRFPEALDVFVQDGRTFLVAGGYGRGIGVFEVSADGALTEVDEFTFDPTFIRHVYDLDARIVGGKQYIYASTAVGAELRSFRYVAEDDLIEGTNGANAIDGTIGDDQILALDGNDKVNGLAGDDMLSGGGGNDVLTGGDGADHASGGLGRDKLYGDAGEDFLFGGHGADTIAGGTMNDYAMGGAGNDTLMGEDGNDRLFGDSGRDLLEGGAGNDTLTDGKGSDTLKGGTGTDVFVFGDDNATDNIVDFQKGVEKIDFRSLGDEFEFLDLTITQAGSKVHISYRGDLLVVVAESGALSWLSFSTGDFLFA